jgi:hypothetical protein
MQPHSSRLSHSGLAETLAVARHDVRYAEQMRASHEFSRDVRLFRGHFRQIAWRLLEQNPDYAEPAFKDAVLARIAKLEPPQGS